MIGVYDKNCSTNANVLKQLGSAHVLVFMVKVVLMKCAFPVERTTLN